MVLTTRTVPSEVPDAFQRIPLPPPFTPLPEIVVLAPGVEVTRMSERPPGVSISIPFWPLLEMEVLPRAEAAACGVVVGTADLLVTSSSTRESSMAFTAIPSSRLLLITSPSRRERRPGAMPEFGSPMELFSAVSIRIPLLWPAGDTSVATTGALFEKVLLNTSVIRVESPRVRNTAPFLTLLLKLLSWIVTVLAVPEFGWLGSSRSLPWVSTSRPLPLLPVAKTRSRSAVIRAELSRRRRIPSPSRLAAAPSRVPLTVTSCRSTMAFPLPVA